jgi:hypothetical protein
MLEGGVNAIAKGEVMRQATMSLERKEHPPAKAPMLLLCLAGNYHTIDYFASLQPLHLHHRHMT